VSFARAACIGAAIALAGCGEAATPAPQVAPAPRPSAAATPLASSTASAITSPEDALLARIAQLARGDFARGGSGATGPVRPHVQPTPFRVADLPAARLEAPPMPEDWKTNDRTKPTPTLGPVTTEIAIVQSDPKEKLATPGQNRNVKLTIASDDGSGLAQIGAVDGLRRARQGGARELGDRCGDGYQYDRYLPIRYVRLKGDGDSAKVTIGDVVFDRVKCEAHAVQHVETTAKPVLDGGFLYATRVCGDTCRARESLMVFYPRSSSASAASLGGDPNDETGLFSVVSISIEHGGGGAMVAAIPPNDLATWRKAMSGDEAPAPAPSVAIVVGLEVTQTVRDEEPFAMAYVDGGGIDLRSLKNRPKKRRASLDD
jgi:hypothetical protein